MTNSAGIGKIHFVGKKYGAWIIVGAAVIAAVLLWQANTGSGKLDGFAQCLKDRGVIFYGAFWCPHCQNQKSLFGKSAKLLPYVECSNPDGQSQNQLCDSKGIKGYPTWVFPDGSSESGEVPLGRLAEKSGCVLPK